MKNMETTIDWKVFEQCPYKWFNFVFFKKQSLDINKLSVSESGSKTGTSFSIKLDTFRVALNPQVLVG